MKKIVSIFIVLSTMLSCSFISDLEPTYVSDPEPTSVSNPEVSVSSLSSPSQITLSTDTTGAKIYYTLDGTTPDTDLYNFYDSTYIYTEPFYLYEPATIKVVASKSSLDDSDIIEKTINIIPVRLSKGETHNFDGLDVTLNDIFWYQYKDFYGNTYSSDKIAFEFLIKNNTGKELDTNPIYAWGNIIEYPSSLQLDEFYNSSIYQTNMTVFSGYSLLPTASIVTSIYFSAASDNATLFKFIGEPSFEYEGTFNDVGYYFEIVFNRTDINTKPIL